MISIRCLCMLLKILFITCLCSIFRQCPLYTLLAMCSMLDSEILHRVAILHYYQLCSSRKKVASVLFFSELLIWSHYHTSIFQTIKVKICHHRKPLITLFSNFRINFSNVVSNCMNMSLRLWHFIMSAALVTILLFCII